MLKGSETPLILLALLPKIIANQWHFGNHTWKKSCKLETSQKRKRKPSRCSMPWLLHAFFFRGCIYLHILTENRFICIQNSTCFILSRKFIGIHFSQYSPMKSHQPDGVRMDVLGCRTFWNFTKRNGTGLRKKLKKGHQKDKDKDFPPA